MVIKDGDKDWDWDLNGYGYRDECVDVTEEKEKVK